MRTITVQDRIEIGEIVASYENNRGHNEEVLLRYCEEVGFAPVMDELSNEVRSSFLSYVRYILQFEGSPPFWYRSVPDDLRYNAAEYLKKNDESDGR